MNIWDKFFRWFPRAVFVFRSREAALEFASAFDKARAENERWAYKQLSGRSTL